VIGCDALPKIQFELQSDIQREFHVTNALVMVVDTTNLVLALFDDARASLDPKERAAFEEEVARYATLHYQKAKLKSVAGRRRPSEPAGTSRGRRADAVRSGVSSRRHRAHGAVPASVVATPVREKP